MGTGSRVGIMVGDKIHSVQVGYDGYLQGVGIALMEQFNTEEKVLELIKRGEIRTLTGEVEYYNKGNEGDKPLYDVDETGTEFVRRTMSHCGEYYYLMDHGVWFCGDTYGSTFMSSKLVPLEYAIDREKTEEQENTE